MATTKEYGILITADIEDVKSKLTNFIEQLSKIPDKVIELTANVNDKPVKELDTELDSLDGRIVKTDVNADISDVENDIKLVKSDIKSIPDKKEVKIEADGTQAEKEIKDLKSMLDELKETVIDFAAGTAIAGTLDGLIQQNTEISNMKKSTSNLSKEMEDVANQVYKVTSADWSTITEAVRYVVGQMGLSGAAAVNMTKQMINFQKAFPWTDTYSLARAISSVMKNMGVDAQTAFNLISLAMQKTQDPGQDLLDTFWEYSNQFARMGWSAQEFTNYLIEGLQEGAFNSDKLGDAFKELTIRVTENRDGFIKIAEQMGFTEAQANSLADAIAKGGPAAKDAVDQINDKFMTLPQSLQDNLGPSLYGTMYEDLRSTIPNSINKALNESVDDTNESARQAGEKVGSNTGQGVLDGLIQFLRSVGLGPVVDGLSNLLGGALEIVMGVLILKLISSLPQVLNIFKDMGVKVSDIIRTWAWGSDAGNASRGLFQAIEGNIKDTSILGRIKTFGDDVLTRIRGWSIWADEAGRIIIDLEGSIENGFEMKPTLLQKVYNFGSQIKTKLIDGLRGIKPAVEVEVPPINEAVNKVPTSISERVTGFLPKISEAGGRIAGRILGWGPAIGISWFMAMHDIQGFINQSSLDFNPFLMLFENIPFIGDIAKKYTSPAGLMELILGKDQAQKTMDFLQKTVSDPFNAWLGTIPNTISSGVGDIGGTLDRSIGYPIRAFFDILLTGLFPFTNQFDGFFNYLAYTLPAQVGTALSGFVNYLGTIPSQIVGAFSVDWNAIGYNIGNGIGQLTVYFLSGLYTLLSALFALPGQAYTAILNLGTWIYNGLIAIPGQIYTGLTGIYNQFTAFLGWLAGLPGQAQSRINKTGADMQAGINAIPGRVQTGLLNIWGQFTAFLGWLAGLPGNAYTYIVNMGQQIYVGIAAIPGQVYNGLLNIWNQFTSFIGWIASLPTQLYNAIVAAWDGFVKGITDKMPEITYWLDKIRGLFPHSPPKWGPLVDIMDWGGNMADAIQQGIDAKFPNIASSLASQLTKLQNIGSNVDLTSSLNLNGVLSSLALPQSTLQNISTPQTTQKITFQFGDIKLEIKNLDSDTSTEEVKQKAQIFGKELSSKVSDELKDQITNKGILK